MAVADVCYVGVLRGTPLPAPWGEPPSPLKPPRLLLQPGQEPFAVSSTPVQHIAMM